MSQERFSDATTEAVAEVANNADVPEMAGEWEPRRRPDVPLPANLPREVRRLVWWLIDVGCTRSPFISHPDCFQIPEIQANAMCARCRALLPYRSIVDR